MKVLVIRGKSLEEDLQRENYEISRSLRKEWKIDASINKQLEQTNRGAICPNCDLYAISWESSSGALSSLYAIDAYAAVMKATIPCVLYPEIFK